MRCGYVGREDLLRRGCPRYARCICGMRERFEGPGGFEVIEVGVDLVEDFEMRFG